MSGGVSRGKDVVGCPHQQWVVVAQRLEVRGGPAFQSSKITFHVESEDRNLGTGANSVANIQLKIQDSNDGQTWVTRYDVPALLTAGGKLMVDYYHVRPYVRLLAYAFTGPGLIAVTILPEEVQALPAYWRPWPTGLACAAYCEVDCETGAET